MATIVTNAGTGDFVRSLVQKNRSELTQLDDSTPLRTESVTLNGEGEIVLTNGNNIPRGCFPVELLLFRNGEAHAGHVSNANLQALTAFETALDNYNTTVAA